MDSILRFFSQYEILFYILLGGVILVFARKTYLSWREWKVALFGLEREHAQRKFNQGLSILVFSGLVVLGLFITNTFITSAVPGVQQLMTPTVNVTEQITQIATTPTIEGTVQGLIPTLAAILDQGCVPGQVEWTFPENGGTITGKVELMGTVNIKNLGFYKYEFALENSETWTTIAAGNQVITDSPLGGAWDTKSLVPGDYKLRLVVSDNQNNQLPECKISIRIDASE